MRGGKATPSQPFNGEEESPSFEERASIGGLDRVRSFEFHSSPGREATLHPIEQTMSKETFGVSLSDAWVHATSDATHGGFVAFIGTYNKPVPSNSALPSFARSARVDLQ